MSMETNQSGVEPVPCVEHVRPTGVPTNSAERREAEPTEQALELTDLLDWANLCLWLPVAAALVRNLGVGNVAVDLGICGSVRLLRRLRGLLRCSQTSHSGK